MTRTVLRRSPVTRMRRALRRRDSSWREALGHAVQSGAVAGLATFATVALAGRRDSGSAVAPLNATSHIVWGESAGRVEHVDAKHTAVGTALHAGACVFWAAFFEKWFGRAARRGDVRTALLGGATIAAAAYVTDYHVVPKRLTPGWESRISGRSLATTYAVLALALPIVGLLRKR